MNISKLIKQLTVLTCILTVFIFIDFYTFGFGYFTIPLTIISAIITGVLALFKKDYLYVLINLIMAIIAIVAVVVLPI